jgi:hypothetical protein
MSLEHQHKQGLRVAYATYPISKEGNIHSDPIVFKKKSNEWSFLC